MANERFYGVTVYDHEGQIVTIEPAMLSGRDIGEREAFAIRAAIRQLAAFVGPERVSQSESDKR